MGSFPPGDYVRRAADCGLTAVEARGVEKRLSRKPHIPVAVPDHGPFGRSGGEVYDRSGYLTLNVDDVVRDDQSHEIRICRGPGRILNRGIPGTIVDDEYSGAVHGRGTPYGPRGKLDICDTLQGIFQCQWIRDVLTPASPALGDGFQFAFRISVASASGRAVGGQGIPARVGLVLHYCWSVLLGASKR